MKLLGISGTILGAKPSILVQKVLDEAKRHDPDLEVELLDMRQYSVSFANGRHLSQYEDDTHTVVDKIESADFYIIGTPIFQGSMTGVLKNLFDHMPPQALRSKVIGFVATGGTYQHFLVIENQLKPIAGYFRAYVAPSYVYAHSDHFDKQNEIIDADVLERISNLAQEVVFMQKALKAEGNV